MENNSNESNKPPEGDEVKHPRDLELLKFVQSVREYHHKALWEEEKHFTWLNSFVLSGELLMFASDKLSMCSKSTLISILTGFGILTSLLALIVVRSESRNFQEAFERYDQYNRKVFQSNDTEQPLDTNNRFFKLLRFLRSDRLKIRVVFQVIFILFLITFVLIQSAFSLVNHLQWSLCW